jgi:CRP-like cAMP-binding protein
MVTVSRGGGGSGRAPFHSGLVYAKSFKVPSGTGTRNLLDGVLLKALKRPGARFHKQQQQQFSTKTRRQKATLATEAARDSPNLWLRIHGIMNQPRTIPIPRWVSPRHYTTTLSEGFGHSSFLLVAIAYAVDDFLQLRILAIAGSTAMLAFTYFHPHGRVLWLPFKWNALFIAINSYRIGSVYLDKWRADQMSDEMRRLHDNHFYVMDTADFARLVRLSETETFRAGEYLVTQGQHNQYVRLIFSGKLNILRDEQLTYQLHEGNFISEAGLHAGLMLRGKVESCCDVVANSDDVKVLRWNRTDLMDLLENDQITRRALKAVLSWDIVSKLKSQRVLLSKGLIDDPARWTQKLREQTEKRYAAILHNMLLYPKYLKERREELHKYREIHHIEDKSHEYALKEVGWTLEEFEAGTKEGQVERMLDDQTDTGLKWFSKHLYKRGLD